MIEKSLFRNDLYFRLGVIKVEVPSLNNRPDDIIPIAKYFLIEFSQRFGKQFTGISPQAESFLKKQPWKGNIRELRNLIERGVLTGMGPELTLAELGFTTANDNDTDSQSDEKGLFPPLSAKGIDLVSLQQSFEKHYIKEALKLAGDNESKAARLLKINHHTFRYRRKKLLES
jgi:DNA-binding NtrC family response regulator